MKKLTAQKILNSGVQDYIDELDNAEKAALRYEERLDHWLLLAEDGYMDEDEAMHEFWNEMDPPIEAADTVELAVSC